MCNFGALISLIGFQWFTLNLPSTLITKLKSKKLTNYKERIIYIKHHLFIKKFNQRAVEQQKSSGASLYNAELDEVVVVIVELEMPLFLRSPPLHLLLWGFWLILLPPKERGDCRLMRHIFSVRSVELVHSDKHSHFLHFLHFSKLILCDGNLRYMMFVEIPAHQFHHVPDFDWDVHLCQRHSRHCFSHFNLY